jgi:solute carrier family 25 S-adenosylmethionine transporter 26
MLRDVPWNALSFCFFKLLCGLARSGLGLESPAVDVACGTMGGAIAAVILTPFDVAKTRLMTQGKAPDASSADADAPTPYSGTFSTIARVASEEGPSALMAGVVPRVLYLAPLASIVFSVYTWVTKFLIAARV